MPRRPRVVPAISRPEDATPVIDVAVTNRSRLKVLTPYKLKKLAQIVARTVLIEQGVLDAELSVLFVDDLEMTALNQMHLRRNESTDVLSFGMREGPGPAAMHNVLGDVVVCVERAERQAQEAGHGAAREIALLLIHGLLHLLGYDHDESHKDAQEMRKLEAACLEMVCAKAHIE